MSGPNNGGTVAVIACTHPHVRLLTIIAWRERLQPVRTARKLLNTGQSEEADDDSEVLQSRAVQFRVAVRTRRCALRSCGHWRDALDCRSLRQLLDSGDKQAFDQMFDEGMQPAPPAQRQNWKWRAKPYGLRSAFGVFTAARRYNLADVTDQITTPLLITDPKGSSLARPATAAVRETSQYQATCRVHC